MLRSNIIMKYLEITYIAHTTNIYGEYI